MATRDSPPRFRIERLDLENFKSYRGFHSIGPFKNFTAIIGPNGSGKSNIMDAICFVLGMKSSALRGADLKDLIYRGESISSRTWVMLQLRSSEGSTLEFKRTILPTGQSEYRVDNQPVSAGGYKAKLESLNILADIKNCVIFQGDVEILTSRSSNDLTALFERISGSDQLRADYDRLLEESAAAKASVAFCRNKIKGVQAEKKQFKDQKVEADRYMELQERVSELTVQSALLHLFYINQDIEKGTLDIDKKKKESRKLSKQDEDGLALLETARRRSADLQVELQSKQKEMRRLERELDAVRPASISAAEQVSHVARRLNENKRLVLQLRSDMDERQARIATLEAELAALEQQELQQSDDYQQRQREFATLTSDQLKDLAALREKSAAMSASEKQELFKLERAQETETAFLRQSVARRDDLSAQLTQLASERDALAQKVSSLDTTVGEEATALAQLSAELSRVKQGNVNMKNRYEEASQQLAHVQDQLRDAKSISKESEREKRIKDTVDALQRLFGASIHGRVLDLIQPTSPDFNRAVSVVLGAQADAIVVEDERVAQECLQYLRDQRLGIATLLPLTSVEGKQVDDSLRAIQARVRPIVDVLQYDRRYHRVVEYIFGRTLLCDDIDTARKLAFLPKGRQRTVSVDGTLISKSGFMTGGSTEQSLERSRQRWTDKAVNELRSRREKLLTTLNELGSSMMGFSREQQVLAEHASVNERLLRHKTELSLHSGRLDNLRSQIAEVESRLRALAPEIDTAQTSIANRKVSIDSLKSKIDAAERTVFAAFEKKHGISGARDFDERQAALQREYNAKRLQVQTQRSRLAGLLAFEKARGVEAELRVAETNAKADADLLKRHQAEAEALRSRVNNFTDALKLVAAEAKSLQETDIAKAEADIKSARKSHESRQKLLAALSKQLSTQEASLELLRERWHLLLRECSVEQTRLPLLAGSAPLLEPTAARSDVVRPDFDALGGKWKSAANLAQRDELFRRMAEELQVVHAEIDRLAPNLKAVDRLEDVRTRLEAAKDELKRADDAERSCRTQYSQTRDSRLSAFMAAFDHVRGTVDTIYKSMTGGAGMADLTLESLEDPFLHGVRYNAVPPSKTFRDIAQLSGGEKTVASLALLFALHSYRPAPFFVMDEIDAALDSNNVETVARYLHNRSSIDQVVLISLKPQCYDRAESLVGVCVDLSTDSSACVSLDLTAYDT